MRESTVHGLAVIYDGSKDEILKPTEVSAPFRDAKFLDPRALPKEIFQLRKRPIFLVGGMEAMRYIRRMEEPTRDHGPQPLDGLMDRWKITNHELVDASEEQLNHKQVQKARKGRQLTLHLMQKLMRALNDAVFLKLPKEQREKFVPYLHKHLFTYAKGYDAEWADPNGELMPE